MYDILIKNVLLFSPEKSEEKALKNVDILVKSGLVTDVLECSNSSVPARRIIDHKNKLCTPGLIDCHTHLIYSGDRTGEFEKRIKAIISSSL